MLSAFINLGAKFESSIEGVVLSHNIDFVARDKNCGSYFSKPNVIDVDQLRDKIKLGYNG